MLKKCSLYVILDKEILGKRDLFDIANIIRDSIQIIQLRDKVSTKKEILQDAFLLKKLLSRPRKLFIINDYLDIARIVDSEGLHLGQGDIPLKIARKFLGKDKIIGISCHNLKQALEAQSAGADYISIGPIFSTPTKPEYKPVGLNLFRRCKWRIKIPLFAIGGINTGNLKQVLSAGVERIAVCRAILQ